MYLLVLEELSKGFIEICNLTEFLHGIGKDL